MTKTICLRFSQLQPLDGNQYRVVVHARNFATTWQRYSLAISGCLDNQEQTSSPSATPQLQNENAVADNNDKPFGSAKTLTSCQDEESELFELELVTAEGENLVSWDVIMPSPEKGSDVIISSNETPEYKKKNTYYYSTCLKHNRYRFKMLNIGDASYRISVGGEEILNSMLMDHPKNLYSFRFRVTANGYAPITRTRKRPK